MPTSDTLYQETVEIIRGDRYSRAVEIEIPGVDLSGAEVEILVRETPGGEILFDAGEEATLDAETEGEIVIVFTIPGASTAVLPDRCTLDLRLTDTGQSLGPLTLVRLHLRLSDGNIED